MRFLAIILLIFTALGHANAQQHYFIYIQSDSQQPFFSRIDKDVYSSSANGYVIIPKLMDSVYQVTVGFPEERWPDYIFNCVLNKKDRGYLLKNFNEKGWGLFNLQTMEVIMGTKVEKPVEQKSNSFIPATNDEFTMILASVVDDPQLRHTELIQNDEVRTAVAKQEIKKPEETKKGSETKLETAAIVQAKTNDEVSAESGQVKIPDSTLTASQPKKETEPLTTGTEQSEINKDMLPGKSKSEDSSFVSAAPLFTKVARTLQYQNKEGMEMIYVDDLLNGNRDTIRIYIPAEPVSSSQTVSSVSAARNISTEKKDSQFLDIAVTPRKDNPVAETPLKKDVPVEANTVKKDTIMQTKGEVASAALTSTEKKDTTTQIKEQVNPEPVVPVKTNSDCKKLATDKDVSSLRSRMIVMKDEDDIVNMALKTFKQKCFTADKIKTLCYVFITDQGKYKLMDAAYPFVSDQENFPRLAFLLTDTYYINRFNALVKND